MLTPRPPVHVTSPCTFQLNQKAVIAQTIEVASLKLSKSAFFGIHIRSNTNDHDGTEYQCDGTAIEADTVDLVAHGRFWTRDEAVTVSGKSSRAHPTLQYLERCVPQDYNSRRYSPRDAYYTSV
jgi:hypothetical protein